MATSKKTAKTATKRARPAAKTAAETAATTGRIDHKPTRAQYERSQAQRGTTEGGHRDVAADALAPMEDPTPVAGRERTGQPEYATSARRSGARGATASGEVRVQRVATNAKQYATLSLADFVARVTKGGRSATLRLEPSGAATLRTHIAGGSQRDFTGQTVGELLANLEDEEVNGPQTILDRRRAEE